MSIYAQKDAQPLWKDISEWAISPDLDRRIIPEKYRTLELNLPGMKTLLAEAPELSIPDADQATLLLQLPMPDGQQATFRVFYAPIMHPDLAKRYPDIRVYAGKGVDDPTATIRFDLTPQGFHAQVRSGFHSTVFIDPYAVGTTKHYISYYRKDFKSEDEFVCLVDEVMEEPPSGKLPEALPDKAGDCQHRNYRLALACTGEYAQYHGGTVAGALAAMNTSMARVNSVLELDLNITFIIIPNNDEIIFLNSDTDPYSNGNGGAMLGQNQNTCDNIIGSSNYDIGHVFSTGGGGVANLRSVCTNNKARGVTGGANPIGDPFDIDYVAHEMGHQLGGNHTQNNSCNRVSSAAFEPGSASTIMGYAGICAPNVQSNSDAYYHAHSIQEITAYMVNGFGNSCAQIVASSNDAPTVDAGSNYTIPRSTPFTLTATASDPDGDGLTYCWEQMDNQIAAMPPSSGNTGGPAFRSLIPMGSPSRTFPNLPAIIANQTPTWEVLPAVGRILNFRVTVRDNVAGGSCTDEDNMVVTVAGNSGPFQVTNPNTNLTWGILSQQMVTWSVAGSNAAPVNTPNVDILLSLDGGFTYPITLATNTPNDGSHTITVPNNLTTTARVMVRGAGNIFFDISNENFTITQSVPLVLNVSGTNVSCFEGFDGTAQVFPTGGDGNYSYQWSNGGFSANIAGLTAGTYFVTVTDGSGASTVGSVTITQPAELAATVNSQDVSCGGTNDGSASALVGGGTMPYTYQWTGPGGFIGSGSLIGNLAAGNYFLTVVDFNGCLTTSSAIIFDDNTTYYRDFDGDGFGNPNNTIQDCFAPSGYVADNTDCNDSNAFINPIATEICDGVDNNCDGFIDEGLTLNIFYVDFDGDGYGNPLNSIEACTPPDGFVADNTDCNDNNALINPGAAEACDGVDNNCNNQIDEGVSINTYYADTDGDGYGDVLNTVEACTAPNGFVANNTDCDDTNGAIHPAATEVCDGVDNNCNGMIDEGQLITFYADTDQDGFGDPESSLLACETPEGYVTNSTDCDDTNGAINPDAEEICDGFDNNCNGQTDEGDCGFVFERGMVSTVGQEWMTIELGNSYNSMVVIASVHLPSREDIGVVSRIRNATGNSFELKIQRPGGGPSGTYDVYYLVVEEGVYTDAGHGITMEARKANSEETARRNHWVFEERAYANTYTDPVVIGQVMTNNDENWSAFWASANGDRTAPPTSSSFAAGKHIGEDTQIGRAVETIGYMVLESGTYEIGGVTFAAKVGDDLIRGPVNSLIGRTYDTGLENANHAVLSPAGMDGGEGGFPMLFGESPFQGSDMALTFDEDIIRDNERKHASEQVAYIAFAGPDPDPIYCGSEGMGTNYEWIEAITVGDLSNNSGNNNGYGDFRNQNLELAPGQYVALTLIPGFAGDAFPESWRIWIDYNRDGDFDDANEMVFAPDLASAMVNGDFTVPNDVETGPTLMRISMKWNATQQACEGFSWGEVEDYTVILVESNQSENLNFRSDEVIPTLRIGVPAFYTYTEREPEATLQLFPNPVRAELHLALKVKKAGIGEVMIMDHLGRKMVRHQWVWVHGDNKLTLDVGSLPTGVYTLLMTNKSNLGITKRFVIQK
ncbi:MAG: hypothetical protein DHS20C18_52050 [Saprospiraceae bacterium]|nr:MAG: hypothetical protein DHS20C18_52050 [Saprospiraceae bacterium]